MPARRDAGLPVRNPIFISAPFSVTPNRSIDSATTSTVSAPPTDVFRLNPKTRFITSCFFPMLDQYTNGITSTGDWPFPFKLRSRRRLRARASRDSLGEILTLFDRNQSA
jgi:hypothetical protein